VLLVPSYVQTPRNLFAGLIAGVTVGCVAVLVSPGETAAFYGAAVQVVPVFLVAVALERTLVETLGTETSVLAEQLARVDREWTPPSSMTRTYYGVGLRLCELAPTTFRWDEIERARSELDGLSPEDIARVLPRDEALSGEDFRRLVTGLASLALGNRPPMRRRTSRVTAEDLLAQWDTIEGALTDLAKQRAADEIRYEVSTAYRNRRLRQRLSVVASVSTLALAELLSFVGLLSPASAYPGLFALTAGAVAASFVAVTIDALLNLFAGEIDVQSAGLDWSDSPVGSHWDAL
jgi:hypothetical protein